MPARPANIPVYRERSALQALLSRGWLPAAKLYPAGPSTLIAMMAKGWVQRKLDPMDGWIYCITTTGESALRAAIPSKPAKSSRSKSDGPNSEPK
jgi:hypothetical protein